MFVCACLPLCECDCVFVLACTCVLGLRRREDEDEITVVAHFNSKRLLWTIACRSIGCSSLIDVWDCRVVVICLLLAEKHCFLSVRLILNCSANQRGFVLSIFNQTEYMRVCSRAIWLLCGRACRARAGPCAGQTKLLSESGVQHSALSGLSQIKLWVKPSQGAFEELSSAQEMTLRFLFEESLIKTIRHSCRSIHFSLPHARKIIFIKANYKHKETKRSRVPSGRSWHTAYQSAEGWC